MTHMNRLGAEASPYLQQHRFNPVDWYPWGEEAFARARAEDKPIFLSIGYATCHWCHVMERESFEDEEVARLMNRVFVSIKVDREERPDIDHIYMSVCQAITGHGGWPLTVVMTPAAEPFYVATYLPKTGRQGRPGMLDLIPGIERVWKEERNKVADSAAHIVRSLNQQSVAPDGDDSFTVALLDRAFDQLKSRYDGTSGGFAPAPKFPTPHHLQFLLRYWKRSGNGEALEMVRRTLDQMRLGGIYDHIGYGFHRYATDASWRVPHFEKMIYDQAGLLATYVEGYQATGDERYADVAREIAGYVLRDMTSPEGGFFSAEDADSEGREGAYYLWTERELLDVLGPEQTELVRLVFNTTPEGNFNEEATGRRTGENILFMRAPIEKIGEESGSDLPALRRRMEEVRRTLFAYRRNRVPPLKDDKVLTDWNGLMIGALANAGAVLDEPSFIAAARKAADFVLSTLMSEDGKLRHRFRQGEAGVQANLDDYAFFVHGLIVLYEASFEPAYLEEAFRLSDVQMNHFGKPGGGFFFTPDDGERLITRPLETYDGATPSGNAVSLLNLLRLARLSGDPEREESAHRQARFCAAYAARYPSAFTAALIGADYILGPSFEVVLVGETTSAEAAPMLRGVRSAFIPNKVVLKRPEEGEALTSLAPYIHSMKRLEGRFTAYVCRDMTCNQPTSDPAELLRQLTAIENPS